MGSPAAKTVRRGPRYPAPGSPQRRSEVGPLKGCHPKPLLTYSPFCMHCVCACVSPGKGSVQLVVRMSSCSVMPLNGGHTGQGGQSGQKQTNNKRINCGSKYRPVPAWPRCARTGGASLSGGCFMAVCCLVVWPRAHGDPDAGNPPPRNPGPHALPGEGGGSALSPAN